MGALAEITKDVFAYFGLEVRRNPLLKANRLKRFAVPKEEWEQANGGFYLKRLNVTVEDETSPLLAAYQLAVKISLNGGQFLFDENRKLRLKIKGIFFEINYPDELFVINEVFVEDSYNFRTVDELVVIDVGLNIGAATLFFAAQPNVRKVYSFELFRPTHDAAQRNISLNDPSKITTFPFGLGNSSRTMKLPYSVMSKAIMGFSTPSRTGLDLPTLEEVRVEDAAEEVKKIHQLEPGFRKICKLDCEGAEFEILDRLFETNTIGLIDVFMIEWHDRSTEDIERKFLASNFQLIKASSGNVATGLIYAFKQSV